MARIIAYLFCLFSFSHGWAQPQLELSGYNTISLYRYYGGVKSVDQDINEGGKIDFGRNSVLLTLHSPLGEKIELSYGLGYSANEFSFVQRDAGISGLPKPTAYDNNIHLKYQAIMPALGFRFPCSFDPIGVYLGINFFPAFVLKQNGYYSINRVYKSTGRTGFSHVDSRLTLSLLFNQGALSHFTLSAFLQPPAIYITNVIEKKISYFNLGIGIGWSFDVKKQ